MIYKNIILPIKHASADLYLIDPNISSKLKKSRPLMIVCPGGAYITLAHRESEPVALKFNGLGFNSIVLRYPTNNENSAFPAPLLSLFQLLSLVKKHAEEWYIDSKHIFLVGFSAGGHLAGLFANLWNDPKLTKQAKINDIPQVQGAILGYPLINVNNNLSKNYGVGAVSQDTQKESYKALFSTDKPSSQQVNSINLIKLVNKNTLPQFIWCTRDDVVVDSSQTSAYVKKLQDNHCDVEYHLFRRGNHGQSLGDFSVANPNEHLFKKPLSLWLTLACNWMRDLNSKENFERY